MGILDSVLASRGNSAPAWAAVPAATEARKSCEVWLNVGVTIPGAGENGTDLFVSLPVGIPLDDLKPVKITGSNQNSINLKQVKNMLLDELQKLGAGMSAGDRKDVPQLSVQVYRIAEPAQVGSAESNPLIAGLFGALKSA